jgi:hypothetical protein
VFRTFRREGSEAEKVHRKALCWYIGLAERKFLMAQPEPQEYRADPHLLRSLFDAHLVGHWLHLQSAPYFSINGISPLIGGKAPEGALLVKNLDFPFTVGRDDFEVESP